MMIIRDLFEAPLTSKSSIAAYKEESKITSATALSLSYSNLTEFISLLKKHCSESFENVLDGGNPIIKGFYRLRDIYYYGNSTKVERQSSMSKNYYTSLTKVLPSWRGYPKRYRSLICGSGRLGSNPAKDYGDKRYVIFPFNGTVIGICPTDDIWGSFKQSMKYPGLNRFNDDLEELHRLAANLEGHIVIHRPNAYDEENDPEYSIADTTTITPDTIDNNFITKIDNAFIVAGNILHNPDDKHWPVRAQSSAKRLLTMSYRMGIKLETENFFEWLDRTFNTGKNNFKLSNTKLWNLPEGREVWFEGKYFMMQHDFFKDYMDSMKP